MDTGTAVANTLITLLTVAAFILSALGLWFVRRDAQAAVARMEADRSVRDAASQRLHEETEGADPSEAEAAHERWRRAHADAGIEPSSYQSISDGREFLAERIIRELSSGSRKDLWLVGIGLLCGLAAGVWSIWLP